MVESHWVPTIVNDKLISWASEIDPGTLRQAEKTARLPIVEGHVALMPDAHIGIGATVGSVIRRADNDDGTLAHTGQLQAGMPGAVIPPERKAVLALCWMNVLYLCVVAWNFQLLVHRYA